MPSDAEISDMVANCEHVMIALDALRNQRMYLSNELHREGAPRPSRGYGGEDEDVNMYNDGMKQSYNVMETKKRRGVSFLDSISIHHVKRYLDTDPFTILACCTPRTMPQLQSHGHP